MTTVPAGAAISIRPMGDANLAWDRVGKTPQGQEIHLYRIGAVPVGMVPGAEQAFWTSPVKVMPLPEYIINKLEVTNREFQQFVDSGGYHNPKCWRHLFLTNGRELPWREAVAEFRDGTGREGPSVWELGTFPKDKGDYPVAGVSWFEAVAYCEAQGKSLPTIHHWQKAAGFGIFSDILLFGNVTHNGPLRVGSHTGITPVGAYDLAGNVKE
jgi:formylglycine-generating enzyme required for sulfatase activity